MGRTTFTGPVRSGLIPDTSGITLGKDVKNLGYAVLSQETPVTQAGSAAALATPIVLPAGSAIIGIALMVTTAWDGVAATFNLGTTVAANELAVASDNTAIALGRVIVNPGASAARVGRWIDTGTPDIRLWFLSTNTGAGVGKLVVTYAQSLVDS
jgi:hypothetical protein